MTANPRDLRYTKEHEWVRLGPDGTAEVGVTHFAQEQLGDIVYIDLPGVGSSITPARQDGGGGVRQIGLRPLLAGHR